jgi:hypothetical protein
MNISFFKANTHGKVPVSSDKEFIFQNKEVQIEDVYKLNKDFWFLNGNFIFPNKSIKARKNKISLTKYKTDEFDYIIIDFDKVLTEFNKDRIVETLIKEDLYFSLWESVSHNGISNFNMKGIVRFIGNNNTISLKNSLSYLISLIGDYCEVDMSSVRLTACQKPTGKQELIKTHYGKTVPDFYFEEPIIDVNITDNDLTRICIQKYSELGFSIRENNDDIISLEHPKEKTKGGYFVYKNSPHFCHHFNNNKSFTIINLVKNSTIYQRYNQEKIEAELENKIYAFQDVKNENIFNSRYINIDKLNRSNLELIDDKVIYVKSPMGTGKTTFIRKYKDRKILIVTNRITLAKEYKEKFPEFKLYNEDLYFPGDSLICQFESLHKYDLKNFDLFIIDEFMSIIEHSLSGLGEHSNFNNLKFYYILSKLTKPILIMDAFLTGIEQTFIKRKHKEYFINDYRDSTNLYKYDIEGTFIESIIEKLKSGKKVTLSTTNKTFGKIVKLIVEEKTDNLVQIISSDTENKEEISKYFGHNTHSKWDLLIYTPSITVGVNILNESFHHFHYSDGVGSVISSIQQVKRNRNAKNIHFFLKNRKANRIIDIEELTVEIKGQLTKYFSSNSLFIELDEFANLKLSNYGLWSIKKIYLNNVLNTNPILSFNKLLKEQFSNSYNNIDRKPKEITKEIFKEYKQKLKELEKELYADKIRFLNEVNDIDFNVLLKRDFKEINKTLEQLFLILSRDEILTILNILKDNKNFLKNLNFLKIYLKNQEDLKNMISYSVNESISQNNTRNLELLLEFKKKNIILKQKFTKSELTSDRFKTFLRLLGYKRSGGAYFISEDIMKYATKLVKS